MLVRIATYITAIDAHLARGRLEVEGIPAFVAHEHHVGLEWNIALAMTSIKIYVHPSHAQRAVKIIAEHDRGEYALQEEQEEKIACPRCHATDISRHQMSWKSAMIAVHLMAIPLFFRWATLKCRSCHHEWDLPNTNEYPNSTIAITVVAFGIGIAFLYGVLRLLL